MSQTSRKVLGSLTQDYLWIRNLANQPESKLTEKLNASVKEFQVAANTTESSSAAAASSSGFPSRGGGGRRAQSGGGEPSSSSSRSVSGGGGGGIKMNPRTKEWDKAVTHLADVASEQLAETTLQNTKKHIFS